MSTYFEDAKLDEFCRKVMQEEYGSHSCAKFFDKIKFVFQDDMWAQTQAQVVPITGPITLFTDVKYIVCFNFDIWAEVLKDSEEVREVLVKHELCHIPFADEEKFVKSRTIPHDRQDFRKILINYGVDWMLDREEVAERVREIRKLRKEKEE